MTYASSSRTMQGLLATVLIAVASCQQQSDTDAADDEFERRAPLRQESMVDAGSVRIDASDRLRVPANAPVCTSERRLRVSTADLQAALAPHFGGAPFTTRVFPRGEAFTLLVTASGAAPKSALVQASEGEPLTVAPLPQAAHPSYPYLQNVFGLAARHAPGDQLLTIFDGRTGASPFDGVSSEARGPEATASTTRALFGFQFGGRTTRIDFGTALDATRSVVVAGNIAGGAFKAAVLGADGAVVGSVRDVPAGGSNVWGCLNVLPTSAAGAVSFMDSTNPANNVVTWHVLELDADANVALHAVHSGPVRASLQSSVGCPTVSAGQDAFASLWRTSDGSAQLVRFDRRQPASPAATTRLALPPDANVLGMSIMQHSTLVALWAPPPANVVLIRALPGGATEPLRLATEVGRRPRILPSDDGSLTLVDESSAALEIVRVTCPDV